MDNKFAHRCCQQGLATNVTAKTQVSLNDKLDDWVALQVFNKIRKDTNAEELRHQAARLQKMCAGMRATLFEHVMGEEQELWPLFAENFSFEEQQDIVGMIIGRTGAEVLQAMLPWVTGAGFSRVSDPHAGLCLQLAPK